MNILEKILIENLCHALGVVVLSPEIQEFLLAKDPKCFWQCVTALEGAALRWSTARRVTRMISGKVYARR